MIDECLKVKTVTIITKSDMKFTFHNVKINRGLDVVTVIDERENMVMMFPLVNILYLSVEDFDVLRKNK